MYIIWGTLGTRRSGSIPFVHTSSPGSWERPRQLPAGKRPCRWRRSRNCRWVSFLAERHGHDWRWSGRKTHLGMIPAFIFPAYFHDISPGMNISSFHISSYYHMKIWKWSMGMIYRNSCELFHISALFHQEFLRPGLWMVKVNLSQMAEP